MAIYLGKAISNLKKMVLQQSTQVEQTVIKSVAALNAADAKSAADIIRGDIAIDRQEIEIEEECLKILALYQPVAFDLRFVITCLKINNDLERVGDLATGIAESVTILSDHKKEKAPVKIDPIAEKTEEMLRLCLDALMEVDITLARNVISRSKDISELSAKIHTDIFKANGDHPKKVKYYLALLNACRHLVRVANYATNIAEDIVYMATGEIIRHQKTLA